MDCRKPVWLGFFHCPYCGQAMKNVPQPSTRPGQVVRVSSVHVFNDTSAEPPVLLPFLGDAWVLSAQNSIVVKGTTGELSEGPVGFSSASIEAVDYGRWLVVRSGEQIHCSPAAFLRTAALGRNALQLVEGVHVRDPAAMPGPSGAAGLAGRLGMIARLGASFYTLSDNNRRRVLLRGIDIRFHPEAPNWASTVGDPEDFNLPGAGWVFDRGASLDGGVLIGVSAEQNQVAVLSAMPLGVRKQRFFRLQIPREAGQVVPGWAAWFNNGLLIACDQGGIQKLCLWEDLDTPPRVLEAPQGLSGLAPYRDQRHGGAVCLAGMYWYDFNPVVMSFRRTTRNVPHLNAVLSIGPAGMVFLSRERRFVEAALPWGGVSQVCQVEQGVSIRSAVIHWPRIWLLFEPTPTHFELACYQLASTP